MNSRPKIIVFSQVYPFPLVSGQNQRIANTLTGLKSKGFHITFFTFGKSEEVQFIKNKLLEYCDDSIVLSSLYNKNTIRKWFHKISGITYTLITGKKFSNYIIEKVEFNFSRVSKRLPKGKFDFALFEYWHSYNLIPLMKRNNTPCIIDIHNILWRNWEFYLTLKTNFPSRWEPILPNFIKNRLVRKYKESELKAYSNYDCLITLGSEEIEYLIESGIKKNKLFKMPMGISLKKWDYVWSHNNDNKKIVYYGGLSNPYNLKDVLFLYHHFMPIIWSKFKNAELWLVGSNPAKEIKDLTKNSKVVVTGFVDNINDVLKDKDLMVMPWSGASGFRSRLIEVMALGLPVLTTKTLVKQMDIREHDKFILANNNQDLSQLALKLLNDKEIMNNQSLSGRKFVEQLYSFKATYGALPNHLLSKIKESI
mgnify:CR=1 FL=1